MDGVAFLQWALPRLGLEWRGYRKVRRQVLRRIARRHASLGLPDLAAYRDRLQSDPTEWRVLDALCGVTVSRFYRDRRVFDALGAEVLPRLIGDAEREGHTRLRAWSAGAGSGEEPYSLALVWLLDTRHGGRETLEPMAIVATERDGALIARAENARYPRSSLRELPARFLAEGFSPADGSADDPDGEPLHTLREDVRRLVTFIHADFREMTPDGPFDLVLCRNAAFMYFDEAGRRAMLDRILACLAPGGVLVIGTHDRLPPETDLEPISSASNVFRAGAR